ncbi:MAG: TatD family hydrolase [Clostridia bacterium]|nr:TatD family hydrolase [Clostridia bacterium]
MSYELFDTHTHYFDRKFQDYPGGPDGAVRASVEAGVSHFVLCATNPENALLCLDFCRRHPEFRAALGLHPEDSFFSKDPMGDIEAIRPLLKDPAVVAVGEIGLDYHYPEETDKKVQKEVFQTQLDIAEETGLPVVIHSRDAAGDTFEILSSMKNVRGVLHCYSGSAEMARQYAAKGWYFSFGGNVTYPRSEKVRESLLAVPREQVLLETDCPYLPPVPHRGEINSSEYLPLICRAVASLWDVDEEECAAITTANAKALFGI